VAGGRYPTDFGKEIIPSAIKSGYNVASYEYNGYWTDVGSVSSFYDANLELTDEIPKYNLFDNNQIVYTRPRLLAPAKISDTKISKSIVSEGSIIHADSIHRSIIGIRSRIGYGTKITASVTMGNDFFETLEKMVLQPHEIPMGIGNNCTVEKAIIDKNCRIGNNVIIRGHESLKDTKEATHCVVDGIVVLRKGAVIPHDTVIGYQESK
jgi:glucose-1-phosphate adenylyltransferase